MNRFKAAWWILIGKLVMHPKVHTFTESSSEVRAFTIIDGKSVEISPRTGLPREATLFMAHIGRVGSPKKDAPSETTVSSAIVTHSGISHGKGGGFPES